MTSPQCVSRTTKSGTRLIPGAGDGAQCASGTAVTDGAVREEHEESSVAHEQCCTGTCSCASSLKKRDLSDACSLAMRQAEPQRAQAKCSASAVAIREKGPHLLRVDTRPLSTPSPVRADMTPRGEQAGRADASPCHVQRTARDRGRRMQTPTAMCTMAGIAFTVSPKGTTRFAREQKQVGLGTDVRLRAFRRCTDEIGKEDTSKRAPARHVRLL